ncbi:hypothetical protein INT45_009419, partial [Circinella minor]
SVQDEILLFKLDHHHRPGSDLMSKWVLLDPAVINLIVETVVGPEAVDEYSPDRTEWKTGKRPDVVYTAKKSKKLPPIVVEIQNGVDEPFICRLTQYCLNATAEHYWKPIAVVFCIRSTSNRVLSNAHASKKNQFMLRVPSYPWAKDCFLLNGYSIKQFIHENNLHPLVALTLFPTEQKQTLRDCPRNNDTTIQMLYRIAMNASDTQGSALSELSNDYNDVCKESTMYLNEVLEAMKKEEFDQELRKRLIDRVDEGLKVIQAYSKKHKSGNSKSPASVTASSSTAPSSTASSVTASPPSLFPVPVPVLLDLLITYVSTLSSTISLI